MFAPLLVAALAASMMAAGLVYGHASAAPPQPGVTLIQASNDVFQPSNFSLSGPITSLAYDQNSTYILQGNWSMSVENGKVTLLDSNITAISNDGQKSLSFQLSNFTAETNLKSEANRNVLYAFGTIDVSSNSTVESVPVNVNIANMKVLVITLGSSNSTNILVGQPIYGTVIMAPAQVASSPILPEANGAAQLRNITPGAGMPIFPGY